MLPMEAAEGFAGIRSTRNANSDGLEPVPIVRTVVLEKFARWYSVTNSFDVLSFSD